MTEERAIEVLEIMKSQLKDFGMTAKFKGVMEMQELAIDIALKSLTEIQQYRAIGTVEECREARERQRVKDIIHNPDGGVDEDWLCPSCGRFCSPYTEHCQHCGQAVKVGDNP